LPHRPSREGLRLCDARGDDFHPAEARRIFASAVEEAGLSVEVGNGELHRIEPHADVLILERLLDDLDDVVAAGRLQLPEAQRGSRSMSLDAMRAIRNYVAWGAASETLGRIALTCGLSPARKGRGALVDPPTTTYLRSRISRLR
jgi:hypothetical protein